MADRLIEDESAYREMVIGLVGTFASVREQIHYQCDVPGGNATAELICQWFDDLYHPDDETWRSLFTPHQLEAMAAFHRLFSAELPHLDRVAVWEAQTNPHWRRVVEAAATAYSVLRAG